MCQQSRESIAFHQSRFVPCRFLVTFSQSVTGFGPSGVALNLARGIQSIPPAVTSQSTKVYAVTVAGLSATQAGNVSIDVLAYAANNANGIANFRRSGPAVWFGAFSRLCCLSFVIVRWIADSTPLAVNITLPPTQQNPTNGACVFVLSFNKAVVSLSSVGISILVATAPAVATISIAGSGAEWFVTATNIAGSGALIGCSDSHERC